MNPIAPEPVDSDGDSDDFEERIAALGDAIERCRKISLFAKITAAAGAIYLAAAFVGLVAALPSTMIAAMAAILGGIVLLGSNASTWAQTEVALAAAWSAREAAQAEASGTTVIPFGRPALRVVDNERPTLH